MPGVHEKFLGWSDRKPKARPMFLHPGSCRGVPKCRNPPDIFFCSADLADKFFDIKKCSLVPAVKDGFISGKSRREILRRCGSCREHFGSDRCRRDRKLRILPFPGTFGLDGFVKLESMIVRMVLMEAIVINGLFYGMTVEAAAGFLIFLFQNLQSAKTRFLHCSLQTIRICLWKMEFSFTIQSERSMAISNDGADRNVSKMIKQQTMHRC